MMKQDLVQFNLYHRRWSLRLNLLTSYSLKKPQTISRKGAYWNCFQSQQYFLPLPKLSGLQKTYAPTYNELLRLDVFCLLLSWFCWASLKGNQTALSYQQLYASSKVENTFLALLRNLAFQGELLPFNSYLFTLMHLAVIFVFTCKVNNWKSMVNRNHPDQ